MRERDNNSWISGALAIIMFSIAAVTIGVIVVANEIDRDVNFIALIGSIVAALGFIGLAAVLWKIVDRMTD